jgi:hypothetical protein
MLHGKLMWCKAEAEIGTKIPTYNCIRDDQVAAAVARSAHDKDAVDGMLRNSLSEPNKN